MGATGRAGHATHTYTAARSCSLYCEMYSRWGVLRRFYSDELELVLVIPLYSEETKPCSTGQTAAVKPYHGQIVIFAPGRGLWCGLWDGFAIPPCTRFIIVSKSIKSERRRLTALGRITNHQHAQCESKPGGSMSGTVVEDDMLCLAYADRVVGHTS